MLLEHKTSPLCEVGLPQLWEELTVGLILAGKIPKFESQQGGFGSQQRIESVLRVEQEKFLHLTECPQEAPRADEGIRGIGNMQLPLHGEGSGLQPTQDRPVS